jgi:methionyl-tRNA formyltransferase
MKYKVVFLGTPEFVLPVLESLNKNHKVVAVITQPNQPLGRKNILTPPTVKTKADELGLKVFQPKKIKQIKEELEALKADFFITYAYGNLIPQSILDLPKKDNLNIHPSLLPLYRGATPPQSALLNGDKKTGVTIIRMVKEMDAGPIFAQQEYDIAPDIRFPELAKDLTEIAVEQLNFVLENYEELTPINQELFSPPDKGEMPEGQRGSRGFCTKITKQHGQINWSEETAEQIYNKLRAYTPWPGIYTFWNNQKLSFTDITLVQCTEGENSNPRLQAGTVYQEGKNTYVKTKQMPPALCSQSGEARIKIKRLQLAGKKETDVKSFINGHQNLIGTKLK